MKITISDLTPEQARETLSFLSYKKPKASHKKHIFQKHCHQCKMSFHGNRGIAMHNTRIHGDKNWSTKPKKKGLFQ